MPFFPYFLQRDVLGWLVALGVLIALAALFPWELGEKADPFAPAPPGIKPEWYFLFMFQTLKYIPAKILFIDGEVLGILAFGLVGLFWLLIPFIDRRPEERRSSCWFTAFGWAAIAFIIIMSLIAYVYSTNFLKRSTNGKSLCSMRFALCSLQACTPKRRRRAVASPATSCWMASCWRR